MMNQSGTIKHSRGAGILALAACASLLPGCVESNSRNRIGEDLALPAFQPGTRVLSSEDVQRADDTASLTSLDRSGWEPVAIAVPVDGVRHRPEYRFLAPIGARDLRRQRREYPTAISALDLDGGSSSSQARFFESILTPIHASIELVRLPFVMIMDRPWQETWSPLGPESYERVKNRGERPETMGNRRGDSIPGQVAPAYEDESRFMPAAQAGNDDTSEHLPGTEDPASEARSIPGGAAPDGPPPPMAGEHP
jgi:hypothetical protein